MRVLILGVLLAACSDPTKVTPAPTLGALAGTVLTQASHPAPGVQVTIRSTVDTAYTAQETTDSLGAFFQNSVPAGVGQLLLRHLPVGCDSLVVAGFTVSGGLLDSTTVQLPCGS